MSALVVDPGVDETKSTIDPHHPLAVDDDASATVDLQHPFYAEQEEKDAKPEAGPATHKDAKPPPPEAGPVTLARLGELLRRALRDDEYHVFGGGGLHEPPVALFYDLDAWETQLRACVGAFGPTFEHAIACKSNPLALMLRRAAELGFGVECASATEAAHAVEACGVAPGRVVFDSPCKTRLELAYALETGLHCNLDNLDELDRATEIVARMGRPPSGRVGVRVNPRVGAGTIAALSVSTSASKFGVDIGDAAQRADLLAKFAARPWLTSVHVHVGSGGMGLGQLVAGVAAAVAFANDARKTNAVACVDIGGGLPVDYGSDAAPDFAGYAALLRDATPELFDGTYAVVTEFGASLNAKSGFLASRIEWLKDQPTRRLAIVHFGADLCLRQAYTADHGRRWAAFDAAGRAFPRDAPLADAAVGGPLCFQGDILADDLKLPAALRAGDLVVMRDAGANSLSLFSRHCSRVAPPVYGFRTVARRDDDAVPHIDDRDPLELVPLKPRERREDVSAFWGAHAW